MHSVVEEYRFLQDSAFSKLSEDRGDYLLFLLHIELECHVVLDIESVCPALFLYELRCLSIEQYACIDLIFFVHSFTFQYPFLLLPTREMYPCALRSVITLKTVVFPIPILEEI